MTEESDRMLLARLEDHPELAGVLYQRHAPAVYRFLARRAGPAVAEDLLSQVFVAALEARGRVTPHESGSALPWLYGIAGNVLRRYFRDRETARPAGATTRDDGMDWDAVEARLDAQARRGQLYAALGTLSPVERELLLLVAWEELSPGEAACALGISQTAARSRLHRARQRALQSLQSLQAPGYPAGHRRVPASTSEEKLT